MLCMFNGEFVLTQLFILNANRGNTLLSQTEEPQQETSSLYVSGLY